MSQPMNVLLVEDYPADAMLVEMEVREELPEARFQGVLDVGRHYIQKPFTMQELNAKVRTTLA